MIERLVYPLNIISCPVLCKSNANTCQQNLTKFLVFRWILDRNETLTTFLQIFEACMVLIAQSFDDIFLDGIHATWNFKQKFVPCSKYWAWKCVTIVYSFKKIWSNLWFGTALCKTPMEFLTAIWVSAQPMLFTTVATLSVSVVSVCLGSFLYFTFGTHHGQSFKLFC